MPSELAAQVEQLWGDGAEQRLVVITGGEPMLQLDEALVEALHARGFRIAVESNGTLPATPGIDWLCISPKAGTEVVQRSGNELKLVWPQPGIDPAELEQWKFDNFLVQPMDCEQRAGGDRRRHPAGDGAAEVAPVAAGAQGGGAALGLSRFRWSRVAGRLGGRRRAVFRRRARRGAARPRARRRGLRCAALAGTGAVEHVIGKVDVDVGGHVRRIAGDGVDRGHVVRREVLRHHRLIDVDGVVRLLVRCRTPQLPRAATVSRIKGRIVNSRRSQKKRLPANTGSLFKTPTPP